MKKVFIVHLPPKSELRRSELRLPYQLTNVEVFAVPVNMKLHAIPVYELYDNAARYGPLFAGIPHILSQ